MSKLTIVANITAKSDKVDFVKKELNKLIEPTRAEAGCLQYDLHQNNDNPAHFMFYETWASRKHWQDHLNTQHLINYKSATKDAVDQFTVFEMTHQN